MTLRFCYSITISLLVTYLIIFVICKRYLITVDNEKVVRLRDKKFAELHDAMNHYLFVTYYYENIQAYKRMQQILQSQDTGIIINPVVLFKLIRNRQIVSDVRKQLELLSKTLIKKIKQDGLIVIEPITYSTVREMCKLDSTHRYNIKDLYVL